MRYTYAVIAIIMAFSVKMQLAQDVEIQGTQDSIRLNYSFINTNPQNANVFINDSLAGTTPFRTFDTFKSGDIIKLRMPGFIEEVINITEDNSFLYKSIDLISLKTIISRPRPSFVIDDTPVVFPRKRKALPIAISALLMVSSGVLAYKFKQDANERYDRYQMTNDQADLDYTNRLDRYSNISLGVSILSLAATGYFLFFH